MASSLAKPRSVSTMTLRRSEDSWAVPCAAKNTEYKPTRSVAALIMRRVYGTTYLDIKPPDSGLLVQFGIDRREAD